MEKKIINSRKIDFAKNTLILFFGKFATQFMSLILLPLYTSFLITEEYGMIDLYQTYITLFVPILTLRVDSAIFRFLIDKRNNQSEKENIITNISFISIIGILITLSISIVLLFLMKIKYFNCVILNLLILMISNIMLQLFRGLGKNLQYSIASIITGFTTLILNIIMIVWLKLGAESILISSSIANIICILYSIVATKYFSYINLKKINKKTLKEIIKYSLPMIPNSLSWWIVNVSDRTIISLFLGTAFNGIYSISCKFSNILNSIFSIFTMSWQESATLHINDKDKEEFFSDMINKILMLFSTLALLILSNLPFVYDFIIGIDYISSYNYIPIILYANTWNVLIGLIGGIYVAKKRTKDIANTTILSAFINIIINFSLVKYIGLYAACISTLIAYFIMGIYRYFDCKKYVNIKLNIKNLVTYSLIFIFSTSIYLTKNIILNSINLIIVIIYSYFINKELINSTLKILMSKMKHKLK